MGYLTISCSLHPESRSRVLAHTAAQRFQSLGVAHELIDLRERALPQCDGADCYDDPNVRQLSEQIRGAKGILLAVPIYNYDAGATAKNLIELTGDAWTGKVVGFACAAGGDGSYMGIMGLANSLMLDFRSVIVPRFVYTDGAGIDGLTITDTTVTQRLDELVDTLVQFGTALDFAS